MLEHSTERELALAPIEGRFIQICKTWGEKRAALETRAAALKADTEAADRELENNSALMVAEFVRAGMDVVDTEKHMEALMEKAFRN